MQDTLQYFKESLKFESDPTCLQIADKYRQRAINVFGKDFVQGPDYGVVFPDQKRENPSLATFWEFIQSVIAGDPRHLSIGFLLTFEE